MTAKIDIIAAQRSGCAGKIAYANKPDALKVAKRMGGPVNVYRCRFCDGFHLGSNQK